ncbi:MAG: pyruvate:ferredoxin (flavodoxin) oxidoreductase, partial [Thermoflexales bacterium]|nr:pyruvate:ferredoxin (flavodoxin) oxidoreductase [Thermoflexales bacterium]
MESSSPFVTLEGNEAAASVAYRTSEVIAIYPITPSSGMSELSDQWSAAGKRNLWGTVPIVQEMQSEGGAAGAVHGALQTGSLATTFTSSQGLLLMIPNMHKIAGELTSAVFQVAARSLAAQGLSIFGDHSDVMQTRSAGWAMLFANSVQEVTDLAAISFASTLEARIPFLHVFDGFRTSSEVNKILPLSDDDLRGLIDDKLIAAHRNRALTPDKPIMRGTAQNPDMYFQGREASNPFYLATPTIVQNVMDRFAKITGRQYHLFDYAGAPDADRVIVIMGSGAETVEDTANYLNARGEKVGVLKVRLFRPFSVEHFIHALPASVRGIAVLDRCKEPGSAGEPLYQDIATAITEARFSDHLQTAANLRTLVGGRYGLSSKEFTPAMVKAIFDELKKAQPKNHFTIGIDDDVTFTSLAWDPAFDIEPAETVRAMFWGLGADGTVGANKNSIKIIGEDTDNYAQGYFVYDSKKSGARTVSHLRFGPKPIHAPYLISHANFIGVHQFGFFERYDVLATAAEGAVVLINSVYDAETVFSKLPRRAQQQILEKKLKLYVIDAYKVAEEAEMGNRINTVMQVCFFAISGVLPRDEAIAAIKGAIRKTYAKRGESVVLKNFVAVDKSLEHMHSVTIAENTVANGVAVPPTVPLNAPDFIQKVTAKMMAGDGDLLPVSAIPVDGTYPTGTTQWERRNIAQDVPVWDADLCIQCGKCVFVCPHAVIRAKVYDPALLEGAPETFKS